MGKTQLQIDIENLKKGLSELRKEKGTGAVDINVIVQKVLAAMPKQEQVKVDLNPTIEQLKNYTNNQVKILKDELTRKIDECLSKVNDIQKALNDTQVFVNELKDNPLLKVVETEEDTPEPEQPPT